MRPTYLLVVSVFLLAAPACATGTTDDLTGLGGDPMVDSGTPADAARRHDTGSTPPPPPPPADDGSTPPPQDDASMDIDASVPPPPMDAGVPPLPDAPMGGAFCDLSNSSNASRYAFEYASAQAAMALTSCDGTTGAGCSGITCCYVPVPIFGGPGCVLK